MKTRLIRLMRALALVGAPMACRETEGEIAPADLGSDTGSDAPTEVVSDDVTSDDATTAPTGHCYASENGDVPCGAGNICIMDMDGLAHCVSDAGVPDTPNDECGLVSCSLSDDCFCAMTFTSFCECAFSVGPLTPPELARPDPIPA